MRPELRHFFAELERFLAGPGEAAGAEALRAAFPGWTAADGRLALYPRFVAGHPMAMLEKNHPITREVLGEAKWAELAGAFATAAPPRSYEINEAADGFAAFLADRVEALGLPAFVPALARFELAEFRVYVADVDLPAQVQAPAPNPTLEVLEHPFRLVPWLVGAPPRPAAPDEAAETVLMWRHPKTLRTRYRVADPGALLALKLVVERIPLAAAAAESGMGADALEALVRTHAADGLVLLPEVWPGG